MLAACTQEQVFSGIIDAATLGNPEAAHQCLHGDDEGNWSCWFSLHLSNAQHFCMPALEAVAPKPLRWEEQPVSDRLLESLVDSVPGSELVLPGRGSPAFYAVGWHNRHQGQISLVGAYDLQSRTGINKWTPWAYDCVYDTFRYEVVEVTVGPVPEQ